MWTFFCSKQLLQKVEQPEEEEEESEEDDRQKKEETKDENPLEKYMKMVLEARGKQREEVGEPS